MKCYVLFPVFLVFLFVYLVFCLFHCSYLPIGLGLTGSLRLHIHILYILQTILAINDAALGFFENDRPSKNNNKMSSDRRSDLSIRLDLC